MNKPQSAIVLGQRIGRGTVIELSIRVPSGSRQLKGARLLCDCGNTYTQPLINLRSVRGRVPTQSCGCLNNEHRVKNVSLMADLHRKDSHVRDHPLYSTWKGMRSEEHTSE